MMIYVNLNSQSELKFKPYNPSNMMHKCLAVHYYVLLEMSSENF